MNTPPDRFIPSNGPDQPGNDSAPGPRSKFLGIWFDCCRTYGRLKQNVAGTHYRGRCPRCGGQVSARIGPGGTDRRFFKAH
ncbi:MAG: hypothetical protein MK085_01370 [Phycisphaerales bacterium]|nr:hypothetical protein [Phycisphaerales bacterium]